MAWELAGLQKEFTYLSNNIRLIFKSKIMINNSKSQIGIVGKSPGVFTIAEVGINHGGSVELCAKMIEAAAWAGADSVKLQTVNADACYVKGTASYREFIDKGLSEEDLKSLMKLSDKLGIILFSTPGDFESLELMLRLKMPAIKISSGLMTNYPLVAEAAKSGLPLIVSTGLALQDDIDQVVKVAKLNNVSSLTLLKCTALYPAPDDSINLNSIQAMKDRYNLPIGYSDHTLDDLACIASVVAGATVIEKHFTTDKTLKGADHGISIEPSEFKVMVEKIKRVSSMMGTVAIRATDAEIDVRHQRYRCLIAKKDIGQGEIFTKDNVGLMRPLPGKPGLPAAEYDKVIGRKSLTFITKNEPIYEYK
jgi:N,N'-diacetyllegionaminate synthase